MAVLLPGKFVFLAHPHTASSATVLALQDAFPEAFDLRPHHMSLSDLRPDGVPMEQISRARTRVWKRDRHLGDWSPDAVRELLTGDEHVFSVIRNPYDFFASCYVRRGGGVPFEHFVRTFSRDPYVRDGKIYYHLPDCHTMLKHEFLQAKLNGLLRELGLPRVYVERHNETKDKAPWETYFTPEAYRIVNDRFGAEFSMFYAPRDA